MPQEIHDQEIYLVPSIKQVKEIQKQEKEGASESSFEASSRRAEIIDHFRERILENKGNTAVISVEGMLVLPYYTWFGTSYQVLASAIKTADENPEVATIELHIASNGGKVEGISLVTEAIKSRTKPIHAMVMGNCNSGAYWIAALCDSISALPSSQIGSIGVMAILVNFEKEESIITMRSSGAKNKNSTEKSIVTEQLDDLEHLMFTDIATGRGWHSEEVSQKTGEGNVFIAKKALQMGLIDKIIEKKDTKKSFFSTIKTSLLSTFGKKEEPMTEEQKKEIESAAFSEGQKQETERVASILEVCNKGGVSLEEASAYIKSKKTSAEVAVEILSAMHEQKKHAQTIADQESEKQTILQGDTQIAAAVSSAESEVTEKTITAEQEEQKMIDAALEEVKGE